MWRWEDGDPHPVRLTTRGEAVVAWAACLFVLACLAFCPWPS